MFEKLDQLTADEKFTFSDLQQQERSAYRRGDYDAAKQAKFEQEKLLDKFKDRFDPKDLENARANWRQASALDDVHDALTSKSVLQPTPVELRPTGRPDPGYINGKGFSKTILQLRNDGTLAQAELKPEHIQALEDLGTLLEKSGNVHKLPAVYKALKAVAGVGSVGTGYAASALLGKVMTDADVAAQVVKALQSNKAPAAAANAYRIYAGASGPLSGASR